MNFIEEKVSKREKAILRFSPEPNGHLHIGHAKSMCLNFGLAEKYDGKCNLRFDDTNPLTEKIEYIDAILEDIKWLGFTPTKILNTSNYFAFIYTCAITLIKKGLAYVDDSTSEEIDAMKGTPSIHGIDSPYKKRTIEENLDLFDRMKNGEFEEGSKTLRINVDMTSPNMILRDPIIYRIINKSHHNTGNEWCVYPMYDFAHPLSDYTEGITDSLCTLEFEIHRPLYMWILENCDLKDRFPEETEFARLNIDYTVMSKRKLKKLVEEKYVSDWNDPRMPTISGLRRRGFTPESIKEFCETISVTKRDSIISYKLLEECLRTDLNKRAFRLMGVMDPILLTITNWDNGTEMVEIENNPENENDGTRLVPFSGRIWIEREDFREEANNKYHRLKLGCEVRLKGAYIIKAEGIIKDSDGNIIEILCTYDPETKSGNTTRKIKGTIHWVSYEHGINMNVNEYGLLFNNSSPDEGDDFTSYLNENSLIINDKAVFEPEVLNCKIGNSVQMMRKGYYVLDSDGKSFNKTVSLKEGWNG